MPLAVTFSSPYAVELTDEESRRLGSDEVRIRTLFSGISAGTELSAYRGTNPYLHKRWDPDRRLFVADPQHQAVHYPLVAWGYEEVGEVVERGADVPDLPPGTIVYGSWGHRAEHVMDAAAARERTLPVGLDPMLGIFSHIGATALNGVVDSSIHLGETAAVFGLGVVGQIVTQLASLSGAEVIAVDPIPGRREMAGNLGTEHTLDAQGAAEEVKRLTGGCGADVCIEASGSTAALGEAIRACAYSSTVVALGFYQGEARGLWLGEEMHHNRITVLTSQIGGVGPALQHRWDRLRLVHTVMRLAAEGKLRLRPLITQMVPVQEAAAMFRTLDQHPEQVLQAVLDFRA